MVVGALFSMGASYMNSGAGSGVVDFFHGLQVAIMLTLMFNLVQFTWWTCKRMRRGTLLEVHTPTLLVLASAILVNIQPMAILVIGSFKLCCGTCAQVGLDAGSCPSSGFSYPPWPGAANTPRECSAPGGNLFWDHSFCGGEKYAVFPTVASGWAIQIVCTWGGYILMFIGIFQATRLHLKLQKKWTAIRRVQTTRSARALP